jgi:hypothetical protein
MERLDPKDAAARLGVNPGRLAALAKVGWPVDASEVALWEASPPGWLVEVRRREAAKAASGKGGNRRPSTKSKSAERHREQQRRAKERRPRWATFECPQGHRFAVKGFGTEDSFAEDAFYALKDPSGWCGHCSGEPVYTAADLEVTGLSKYRIGKLPEPDYYEPNPVDERFAPARLWTASTLRTAGVYLTVAGDSEGGAS